jgi:thiamine biosynthesis protein ThiS
VNILINGEQHEFDEEKSLSALVAELGFQNKKIAVELNELIVPSGKYGETAVKDGDRLEIVHAIGGG